MNVGEKHRLLRLLFLDDALRYACLGSTTDVLAIEGKLSLNGRLLNGALRYVFLCSIVDVLAIERRLCLNVDDALRYACLCSITDVLAIESL